MKKKALIFSLLAMLGLACIGGWYFISQSQTQAVKAEARKTFIQSSRPTIFFHGWGSSSRAERHMANAAGHYNGIIGMNEPENNSLDGEGKPTSMTESYEELLSLGDNYPQGQVEVLNIYGNTGKVSDERVTNLSSQSLAYLLKGHVKSYQEKEITGPNGQHSKLHETALVDKPLIAFLWGK